MSSASRTGGYTFRARTLDSRLRVVFDCWHSRSWLNALRSDLFTLAAMQDFAEKPKGDALTAMQVDTTVLGALRLAAAEERFACTDMFAQELPEP